MLALTLLSADAQAEAAAGLALILFPASPSGCCLLRTSPSSGSLAPMVGIALLALSVGCWLGRRDRGGTAALASLLVYNILRPRISARLGMRGELVGPLPWPVDSSMPQWGAPARHRLDTGSRANAGMSSADGAVDQDFQPRCNLSSIRHHAPRHLLSA